MNDENLKLLKSLIGDTYLNIAEQNRNTFSRRLRILLEQKKIPEKGFSDNEIEIILREFSNLDANNAHSFCGIGEREGRVYSNLVKSRHFGLSHGIGRSGDICALQPKGAGSSAINALTNSLILHLFHIMGMRSAKSGFIVPMATGMTLSLAMLSLRSERPMAKYVIWSRIDQKSSFKSIITAGYEPLIVDPILVGDELQTDISGIEKCINEHGSEKILCIMTTTSCFAPRVPDDVIKVSKICHETSIPHIINNAYGLTLKRCMNIIEEATKRYGKSGVHVVVQSTDKNLLVPVGGAIAVSCDGEVIKKMSKTYAGRASATPSMDVLITLLSMGVEGFKKLVSDREDNFLNLTEKMLKIATKFGLRLMNTPHNPVSMALTITRIGNGRTTTELGSYLFHRSVSGARIVESALSSGTETEIEGHTFIGYGSHSSKSTEDYLNVAAAIGQRPIEIDRFIDQLDSVLSKFYHVTKGHQVL